jgi:hypothetical protein
MACADGQAWSQLSVLSYSQNCIFLADELSSIAFMRGRFLRSHIVQLPRTSAGNAVRNAKMDLWMAFGALARLFAEISQGSP